MPTKVQSHRPAFGRGHLATVLASACAAMLVGLGIGTGREAESAAGAGASDGSVVAMDGRLPDGPAASDAATRATDSVAGGALNGFLWRDGSSDARGAMSTHVLARILPGFHGRSGFASAPWARLEEGPASVGSSSGPGATDASTMASFNGRPIRLVRTMRMKVTAYSPDHRSCGASADGITASGYSVLTNGGCMVAADPRLLPLGSLVSVPGYDGGAVVPVLDTGGAIKGQRLDVLYPTHEIAMQWGVRELEVGVWEYADGLPNGFRRMRRPTTEPRVVLPAP